MIWVSKMAVATVNTNMNVDGQSDLSSIALTKCELTMYSSYREFSKTEN